MLIPRLVAWKCSVGLLALNASAVCGPTWAQDYPNKPIRAVTSEPGGGPDFAARVIAQGITGVWGQPVVVDNRGGGIIPGEVVSRASADGYTLLVIGNSFWIGSLLQKTPYDPVKDFSPITLAGSSPNILVVTPSLPVASVKDLIALAKAKPGALNYASSGSGSSSHLAAELFKAMAGVNIVRIPYKGSAQAITDVIAGQVQVTFANASAGTPHVKSGKLKGLAVTSAQPSALLPGLPTVAASGVPGYESGAMTAAFVPAKTPATLIKRLNQEIVRVLKQADVKEKFFNTGVDVVANSPEQFAAIIKSDMARMDKVIKDAGIKTE